MREKKTSQHIVLPFLSKSYKHSILPPPRRKPHKSNKKARQKRIECDGEEQCNHVVVPIPHIHKGGIADSSCSQSQQSISNMSIAADSVLSNYVGGGAALATLSVTLLALCKNNVCFAIGYFNLFLTFLFLIVSALHYINSINQFRMMHAYMGNRTAAILIMLQGVFSLGLIFADIANPNS
jgi:hypothetical protein